MVRQERRRDHFDDLGLPERETWRARLRYVGTEGVPLEEAIDRMMRKYVPIETRH